MIEKVLFVFLLVILSCSCNECKDESCFNKESSKPSFENDPFFSKFPTTDIIRLSNGQITQLPFRVVSEAMLIYGSANLNRVKSSFYYEGDFSPIAIGNNHASVAIWIMEYSNTDAGPYNEIVVSVLATKGKELKLPLEHDFSYVVTHEEAYVFCKRLYLDSVDPILAGREIWGFYKHARPVPILISNKEDLRIFNVESDQGKLAFKGQVKRPSGAGLRAELRINVATSNDFYQTHFNNTLVGTQFVKPWDPQTDELIIGDDSFMGEMLRSWEYNPKVILYSPDFKFLVARPQNWLPADFFKKID